MKGRLILWRELTEQPNLASNFDSSAHQLYANYMTFMILFSSLQGCFEDQKPYAKRGMSYVICLVNGNYYDYVERHTFEKFKLINHKENSNDGKLAGYIETACLLGVDRHTLPQLNAVHVTDAFYPQSRQNDQEQNLKCSHIWELDPKQVKINLLSQG